MADCQYYQIHILSFESNPISNHMNSKITHSTQCPWCSHPQSPVSERAASKTIGGEKLLQCQGFLAKCQIR